MIRSVALTTATHHELSANLLRSDGQEDLCFALWWPSRGRDRMSALVGQPILPGPGERHVHGNASFDPAYFERAIAIARAGGAGLALLHSHLGPGWQGMSPDDVAAEHGHAAAVMGATELPLLGLTEGTDGAWSARLWERTGPRIYDRKWCESVRVAGDALQITFHPELRPRPPLPATNERTVSAWGSNVQSIIARLRIAVVGAGSVGALVAEALARTGVGELRLIDFDSIELVNLDRLLYATRRSVRLERSKVENLGRFLPEAATAPGFRLEPLEMSVVERAGLAAALDCDLIFSCVDRPWPRYALNILAYAHLIPVVDGGIAIRTRDDGRLRAGTWRAHVAAPGRRCLACLRQYSPELVEAERSGLLDDPRYIEDLPANHELRRRENVFPFSMTTAGLEIGQALSMIVAPSGYANVGAQTYHFVSGSLDQDWQTCDANCNYSGKHLARGDLCELTEYVTVEMNARAENVRADRLIRQRRPRVRLRRAINSWIDRLLG